jgi:hypothetical protein
MEGGQWQYIEVLDCWLEVDKLLDGMIGVLEGSLNEC